MKNKYILLTIFIFASVFSNLVFAQAPQKFNYQGIARDVKGNPMAQQRLSLKLSVLPTSDAQSPEYEETQMVITNEFGLYTLQIGNGTAIIGEMSAVKWETGNKYIKVAIDPQGGSNYIDAGTTQLLSVPYAIYADKAGVAKTAGGTRTGAVSSNAAHANPLDSNYVTKFTKFNEIGRSQLFDNGTNMGIGTTSPSAKLHMNVNVGSTTELIRMQNINAAGAGRFTMYGDNPASYATFTKYGSAFPGGYPGITTLFPYANLLGFGNNNGNFLLSNSGSIGISMLKGGVSNLKFYTDFNTGYIGIGGNAIPSAKVNFNTSSNMDTIKLTNSNTGYLVTDGTELRTFGNNTLLMNLESTGYLSFGTNNTQKLSINPNGNIGINTIVATQALDINGQVRIQGGAPGAGKVLTSDATGVGTWSNPVLGGSGTLNYVAKFTPTGAAIGNSAIYDSLGYVRINSANNPNISNSSIHIKAKDYKTNYFTYENTGLVNTGQINTYMAITDSLRYSGSITNYKALLVGNAENINNALGLPTTDSVAGFTLNPYNKLLVGAASGPSGDGLGLLFNLQNGKMSAGSTNSYATSSDAHFSINSTYDTAAYFTSSSANQLANGILRAEYNGSSVDDHVAIYGKSTPGSTNYGIGVKGEGGYIGVQARSTVTTGGGNIGVEAIAKSNGDSRGLSGFATYDASSTVGSKVGVYGDAAGGLEAIGVQAQAASGITNYGIYATAPTSINDRAGLFIGDVQVVGNLSKSGGTFKIDHPMDPENKYLIHSFVESPDMMNIYNGNITTDANGDAIVEMPDYFNALNSEFRYQLTVMGATFAQAIVAEKISGNTFKIKTNSPNIEVSWQVTGVRKDPYANAHRVVPVVEKEAQNKGLYLNPLDYNQPLSKGIYQSKDIQRAEKAKQMQQLHNSKNQENTLNDAEGAKKLAPTSQLKPFTTK